MSVSSSDIEHPNELPRYLKVGHFAEQLDCSESFVYKLISQGAIAPVRLGNSKAIRIPASELDRLAVVS